MLSGAKTRAARRVLQRHLSSSAPRRALTSALQGGSRHCPVRLLNRLSNRVGGVRFGSQATNIGGVTLDKEVSEDLMQQELEYFVLGTDEGLDDEDILLLDDAPPDPYDDLLPYDESMLMEEQSVGGIGSDPSDWFIYKILPVDTVHSSLSFFHDFGLPWYSVIILTPCLMKATLTIPLAVYVQHKQQKTMPRMNEGLKRVQAIKAMYKEDARLQSQKLKDLRAELGFNPVTQPLRNAMPLICAAPIHMTFFFAIRTMYPKYEDWATGGLFWFKDLSIPDPSWALPVMCGTAILLNFEIVAKRMPDNPMKRPMIIFTRVMGLVTIPIMHFFTAGFNLYAVANTLTFALQSRLLYADWFRKFVGLKPQSYMDALQKQTEQARKAVGTRKKDEGQEFQVEQNTAHTGVLYDIKPADPNKMKKMYKTKPKPRKLKKKLKFA